MSDLNRGMREKRYQAGSWNQSRLLLIIISGTQEKRRIPVKADKTILLNYFGLSLVHSFLLRAILALEPEIAS
jgi:hypothetical protein